MMEGTIVPDHPEVFLPRLNLPHLPKHLALTTMGSSSPTFPATQKRTVETWSIISMLEGPLRSAEVLSPGKCNIMIKLAEGYEDEIELSDDPISAAATSIECAMGTGEFRLETRGEGSRRVGIIFGAVTTVIGGKVPHSSMIGPFTGGNFDQGYQLDITMNTYKGTFIHEEFTKYDADGVVQGSVQAYSCRGLASTGLF